MFTTTAYAQAATPAGPDQASPVMEMLVQLLPFIAIFVVFYFLLIRPQQTRQKQLKTMLDTLAKGDEVVTAGGIIGKVSRVVDKDEVAIEVASGVELRIVRSTIALVRKKDDKAA